MVWFFAHAGEDHATAAQASVHLLQEWYVALPLFILAIVGFASLVYVLSGHSKPATYMAVVVALFVCGVVMYDKSAIISIVALAGGMALVLVSVLVSLIRPDNKPTK